MNHILKILLIFIFFTSFEVFSQKNQIHVVSFNYSNSISAAKGNSVKISIYPSYEDTKLAILSVKIDNDSTSTQIPIKKFDDFCQAISKIKYSDIVNSQHYVLDSADTEISFSTWSCSSNCTVSGLNRGDENTVLKDFLNATKMFLEIAGVKISEIN